MWLSCQISLQFSSKIFHSYPSPCLPFWNKCNATVTEQGQISSHLLRPCRTASSLVWGRDKDHHKASPWTLGINHVNVSSQLVAWPGKRLHIDGGFSDLACLATTIAVGPFWALFWTIYMCKRSQPSMFTTPNIRTVSLPFLRAKCHACVQASRHLGPGATSSAACKICSHHSYPNIFPSALA